MRISAGGAGEFTSSFSAAASVEDMVLCRNGSVEAVLSF